MSFLNIVTGNSWKGVLFHLALILVVGFGLISYFFNSYLPQETMHGKVISLPSIENLPFERAKSILEEKGLQIVIRDTVYSPKHRKSAIVSQLPRAKKDVKLGRKVYVDINRSNVPTVTFSQMLSSEGGGLILTDVETAQITASNLELVPEVKYINKPNNNFVYGATYKGKKIEAGMKIPIGSTIILETGNGKNSPNLSNP